MKKILTLALCAIMALAICSCGDTNVSDSKESTSQATQPTTEQKTGFEQFSEGLSELGLTCEETIIAAEMVGAKEARRYEDANNRVELYLFEDGDAFDTVKSDKAINLEGFGSFPVEIHGNYALLISNSSQEDEILSIFNNLK